MNDAMGNKQINDLCQKFSASIKLDYLGFWEIVTAVENGNSNLSVGDRRAIVMAVLHCLLSNGVRPFHFESTPPKPVIWQFDSADEAIEKIDNLWAQLPGRVGLGDVCWFRSE
jgi:hypothetical protein